MKPSWERGRPARTKPDTASAIFPTWIDPERPHGCRLPKRLNAKGKGTLLTCWNNFVPASEFWLADNERSTFRQARLNGPGSQHVLSHDAVSSPSGHTQGISESPCQVFPVIQQRPLFPS